MDSNYRMRVLLVQTAYGLTPSSGGYKANISLLRQLSSYGHETAQICYGSKTEVDDFIQRSIDKGIDPHTINDVVHIMDDQNMIHELWIKTFTAEDGVRYIVFNRDAFVRIFPVGDLHNHTAAYLDNRSIRAQFRTWILTITSQILTFRPTHFIFNDPLSLKLSFEMRNGTSNWSAMLGYKRRNHRPRRSHFRRICIIHTAEQLPFGPYSGQILGHCISPIPEDQFLRSCDGIWTVSKALQEYAKEHGDLATTQMVHSTFTYLDPHTGQLPTQRINSERYEIGMINPCPHKGLDILLGVAEVMPHVDFVVWTSWGSQPRHIQRMHQHDNIIIEETATNTDEIWSRIRALIVPSVWFEAWGMVATEAQLRGIPVVASDAGGLIEAKAGVPYTVPVELITGQKDGNGDYVVPRQDLTRWIAIINELVHGDPSSYEAMSTLTFSKTRAWLNSLDERETERQLLDMVPSTHASTRAS